MANKDDMQILYDKLLKKYSFLHYTTEDLDRILLESKIQVQT